MFESETYVPKALECIRREPRTLIIDTHQMGLPDDVGSRLAATVRELGAVSGVIFRSGTITASVTTNGIEGIPYSPKCEAFWAELRGKVASISAHKMAQYEAAKAKVATR